MQSSKPGKDIVVMYHAHCPDGMGSAWCAWKKFGNDADYIAVSHGDPIPEGLVNKSIYLLDFSYGAYVLKNILEVNKKVVVLDHHISAKEDTVSIPEGIFDQNRSGSGMSWDYFFPGEKRPTLIDYIEDGDLFRRSLPDQEQLSHRIIATPFTMEAYDDLAKRCDMDFENVLREGSAISLYVDQIFDVIGDDYDMVVFEGITMPAINVALPLTTKSQLLNNLCRKVPPIAMSYRYEQGFWKVSLRSDGSVDCVALAKKYGGGGHASAAGFIVAEDLPLPFAASKIRSEVLSAPSSTVSPVIQKVL